MLAVGQGHKEIVEILIIAGADLSFKSKGENTVLHHAATVPDSTEIIQMLISRRGALVSERNESGDLPLHVAVNYGVAAEVVKLLAQSYPEATGKKGTHEKLPLELAVELKSPLEVVQALLDQGKLLAYVKRLVPVAKEQLAPVILDWIAAQQPTGFVGDACRALQ